MHAFSLGFSPDVCRTRCLETALGAMVTFYAKPGSLDKTYGDFPVGFQLFLRLRPRAAH